MATTRQVEARLKELIRRLDANDERSVTLSRTLPEPRIIEVSVTDLGETFWTELAGGRMGKLHRGSSPGGDIRVTASSDELVAMVDGTRSLFSSYLGGKVKVEASFADLMRLGKLA
jgi:SCP-2 sterol transfer family protein